VLLLGVGQGAPDEDAFGEGEHGETLEDVPVAP
jgi:hypothetical protein